MSLRTIFSVVLLSVFTSLGTTFLASKFSSGDNSLTSIQVSQLDLASLQERINELEQDRRVSASAGQLQQPNLNSPSPALLVRGQTDIEGEVEDSAEGNEQARLADDFRSRPVVARERDVRRQNLVQGGFTVEEADWVLQQESDVQLDSLFTQYEARKKQTDLNRENGIQAPTRNEQLKAKLGLDYYERYLEANGYSTSINIGSVLRGSPGENAGLQAGDQILYYGGERVFNIRELNGLTLLGEPGQSVLIELERDGAPMQLTIPRGPIGIMSGRRGRNRF
ncbi:MAG: PDZ domain-containing protein [Gammaproteobacteria bacterium]|nr:PDZ domain-containing protein [Gammaproteobacteria bacterium]